MDNPINERLRTRALDMALQGTPENGALELLAHEFPGEPSAAIKQCVTYAYQGESPPDATHELAEGGFIATTPAEKAKVANYLKRAVRKATIMLKVNYGECESYNVADAVCDLMHLCAAKGWSFDDAVESGLGHFQAERRGGQHG